LRCGTHIGHCGASYWTSKWVFCLLLSQWYPQQQSIPEIDQESTKRTHSAALQQIRNSRLTDAELVYTPSQIAVACLYIADAPLAEKYLANKGSGNVLSIVQQVAAMIERDGKGADVAQVREIDRRLKQCKNPERVKGTRLCATRFLMRVLIISLALTGIGMKHGRRRPMLPRRRSVRSRRRRRSSRA
jgi:hypothetical protein